MYVSSLDLDQTHDINHLLGTDAHHQKRSAALFIMKMKETHRLSQVAVDDVVEGSRGVGCKQEFVLNFLHLELTKQRLMIYLTVLMIHLKG